jgi:hypothetical protein
VTNGSLEVTGGFEAIYVPEDGCERRVGLDELGGVDLEAARPVRSFPSYRGQRNYPGWYWSATMGRRVGFESWVERDHLVAIDFDPAVTAVASQPFWLLWAAEGRRRHAPDFFVRVAGGGALVLDSRPLDRIGDGDREAFAATEQACALLGWRYAVWGRMGGVQVANQRWLAGYRHPRCHDEAIAARLLTVFRWPQALMAGAERAGDPIATLPVLYHLMWRHELEADLSLVLSDRTLVRTAGAGGGRG